MNHELLAEEIAKPEYANLTDAEIIEALNAPTVEYYIEPETPELTNYLMNQGLYQKLIANYRDHPVQQIRVAAECAIDLASSQIPNINLENLNVQAMIAGLVQGGVWTQADADSVFDFAKRTRSIADELGGTATENDLTQARLYPKISALQVLSMRHARAANAVTGTLAGISEQLALGEDVTVPEWDDLSQAYGETE